MASIKHAGTSNLGKQSLFTPEANRTDKRQLVGMRVPEGAAPITTGTHLIPASGPRRSLGFFTSNCRSPALNWEIAGDDPARLIGGGMLATAFLSFWISNTASAIVMLPIAA